MQAEGKVELVAGRPKPLRPRRLGQLPTSWGAFRAGKARVRSRPLQGRWPSEATAGGALAVYPSITSNISRATSLPFCSTSERTRILTGRLPKVTSMVADLDRVAGLGGLAVDQHAPGVGDLIGEGAALDDAADL